MTDPTPLTDRVRRYRVAQVNGLHWSDVEVDSLVSDLSEAHNQVAAERDALRSVLAHFIRMAELRSPRPGALPPFEEWEDDDWHDSGWTPAEAAAIRAALDVSGTPGEDTDRRHGKAEADLPESIPCPRCGGDAPWDIDAYTCRACGDEWPADSADTPDEHADGEPDYPLIDWRKANREQWERGTPGEDTAPACTCPYIASCPGCRLGARHERRCPLARGHLCPPDPVCATCKGEGGRYHNSKGILDGPWRPCPACRPVGDLPGDTAPADKARQMIEDVTAEHARTWKRPGTAPAEPAEPVCAHPNRAFTVGGPDVSDGYVWCPDCRTNLTAEAPAEPVCTTCNDTRRIGTEWDDVGIPCPDCRPVGDLPEDTGNQPRRRYVHPDPATQAQQVAADASERARRNSQEAD